MSGYSAAVGGSGTSPRPRRPRRVPKPRTRRHSDSEWRAQVMALRGAYCRCCGSTSWLQADHVLPKSQGNVRGDVEDGLVLCESDHRAKTEHRLLIQRDWLDPDQIKYLRQKGWVWWDENGEVYGRGRRSFAQALPRRRGTG